MTTPLNGVNEGDFHRLAVLNASGVMTDILSLISSAVSTAGAVQSATAPLAINSGVLSINLGSYSTTAQVNTSIAAGLATKLDALVGAGAAVISGTGTSRTITVDLSAYLTSTQIANYDWTTLKIKDSGGTTTKTLTNSATGELVWSGSALKLTHSTGVTAVLTLDASGNLLKGTDGLVTVGHLAAWSPLQLRLSDSGGTSRLLQASLTGALTWSGSQVALTNDLVNKIDTLVAGTNVTITGTGNTRTINATGGTSLAIQKAGVAQTGVTALNFPNTSVLANGVFKTGYGLKWAGTPGAPQGGRSGKHASA